VTSQRTSVQRAFEWTPAYWQGWRESLNPYRQYKSQRDRELALQALQLRGGDRVLEVGCGYGWVSRALWQSAQQIEWVGVDRSEAMIQGLGASPESRMDHASVADAHHLPFRDATFDKVLCTGVLMHLEDDLAAVRELVRVLRPGGLLLCSVNNLISPYSLPVRVRNAFKDGFVQKFRLPGSFRRKLCRLGLQPGPIAGDGILATVPLSAGRFSVPPKWLFPLLRAIDRWAVIRFPWLAYEVWLTAMKA
jgi:SAM-dependent methyltransferase